MYLLSRLVMNILTCLLSLCLFTDVVDAFALDFRPSALALPGHATASRPVSSLFSHENDDGIQEDPYPTRKTRQVSESDLSKRFATGDELKNLRHDLESLRNNLQWAEAMKDENRIESLSKAIKNGEKRDPGVMYKKALQLMAQAKLMKDATSEEQEALTEKWSKVAAAARQCLPQFNLDGLWVGKYGEHGPQLINITYTDDTLQAFKVTGDRNVPRGEMSFSADLSPCNASALTPISISTEERSGEFERYPGRGQVSRKGFKDNRYVEGQMVLCGDQFSFVWIPTKHHVLFTRPSPEMTLRLLRNTLSKEDELENQRNHVKRCFEMDLSTCIARQQDPANFEPLRRITPQEELDEAEKRLQKQHERHNFWQLNKWKKYIDQALDNMDC